MLLVLGLEIPRQSQAMSLGWLLSVPVNKRYWGWRFTEDDCCLMGFRKLWSMSQDQPFIRKVTVNSLGGPRRSLTGVSADLHSGANSVSQVDGISDKGPFCQLLKGGLKKGTMASAHLSIWEKTVPKLPTWCQTLQFPPVCHWCLLNCYPGAGPQRE